jgi:hypothetical protein
LGCQGVGCRVSRRATRVHRAWGAIWNRLCWLQPKSVSDPWLTRLIPFRSRKFGLCSGMDCVGSNQIHSRSHTRPSGSEMESSGSGMDQMRIWLDPTQSIPEHSPNFLDLNGINRVSHGSDTDLGWSQHNLFHIAPQARWTLVARRETLHPTPWQPKAKP